MRKQFTILMTLLFLVSCGSEVEEAKKLENELEGVTQPIYIDEEEIDDVDLVMHQSPEVIETPDLNEEGPSVNEQETPEPVVTQNDVVNQDEIETPEVISNTPDLTENETDVIITDDTLPTPDVDIPELTEEERNNILEEERVNFPCANFVYDEDARRDKLEPIVTNSQALNELIEVEKYVCKKLSDRHLRKWINSRAYSTNEYTIIKEPHEVNSHKKNYYAEFLSLDDLSKELQYLQCRGVYYINAPWPEYSPDSERHNGFMIQIKGRFFGNWAHCGYPAAILLDLVGEDYVRKIEAGQYKKLR